MAQSDRGFPGTIDRGSAARLKFLEVWEAMDTLNAGATAPSVTWPYMWWADTTANRLRQRNAANSAWIDVMPLAVALDGRYARLSETNSFQQPQEVAQRVRVGRVDTGSEGGQIWSQRAVDGAGGWYWQTHGPDTAPILRLVDANGTPAVRAWFTTGGRLHLTADATAADQAVRKGQLDAAIAALPAPTVTVSATATVTTPVGQVDLSLPSGPAMFLLHITNLRVSSAGTLWLRTSSDGITFQSGASDYTNVESGTPVSAAFITLSPFIAASDSAAPVAQFTIDPGAATAPRFSIVGTAGSLETSGIQGPAASVSAFMGGRSAAGRQQAIRLYMSSGNINRATIRLIGVA